MDRLDMRDMNSLNAIAGMLRFEYPSKAQVLLQIQGKASHMLHELAQSDCQEADTMHYIKTVNVTNTKNVLVQVPGWVVKRWGLEVGNTLEVCYDADKEEICIRCPIYPDVQGRGEATQGSN